MRTKRFSLVELVTVIGVIAILFGLIVTLVPTLREKARMTRCVSNLRQSVIALVAYATDNNGLYPARGTDPLFRPMQIKRAGFDMRKPLRQYVDPNVLNCPYCPTVDLEKATASVIEVGYCFLPNFRYVGGNSGRGSISRLGATLFMKNLMDTDNKEYPINILACDMELRDNGEYKTTSHRPTPDPGYARNPPDPGDCADGRSNWGYNPDVPGFKAGWNRTTPMTFNYAYENGAVLSLVSTKFVSAKTDEDSGRFIKVDPVQQGLGLQFLLLPKPNGI